MNPFLLKKELIDWKCIKTLFVEETWAGGNEMPQYSPIIGAVFESPSYSVSESYLEL